MPKFRHQDEEEFDIFCDFCQVEHSSNVPEKLCREEARKLREAARANGRRKDEDDDED
jgi:hypothetical protein